MDSQEQFNHFIAGFVTGEGSFFIARETAGGRAEMVRCGFSIKIRVDDLELIRAIWRTLSFAGNIHHVPGSRNKSGKSTIRRHDAVLLSVRKLDELTNCIVLFFDKYPLRGQKLHNFEIWKQAVQIFERGEHLTLEGFGQLLELKAEMNQYRGKDEPMDDIPPTHARRRKPKQ